MPVSAAYKVTAELSTGRQLAFSVKEHFLTFDDPFVLTHFTPLELQGSVPAGASDPLPGC